MLRVSLPSGSFAPLLRGGARRGMAESVCAARVTTPSAVVRRPDALLSANKPVNLLVLGPPLAKGDEAVVQDIASVANLKGRGTYPDDFQHLTEEDWEELEVVLLTTFSNNGVESLVRKARNLKWFHTHTAGINHLVIPAILESEIAVTNAKGVYSHSLAEYAMFACSYFAKNLPRLLRSKAEKKWDEFAVEELRGRTMGVVGLGDIGLSTAKMAKAFGMNVIGVRRTTTLSDAERSIVDAVYGPGDLVKVMGSSDYVVAALPMTGKTVDMIDAEAIAALRPNAVFVNIGRGKTVVEPALIKALQERRIKGAALDVFYEEPLPKESPLYELDNVLISSHTADTTEHSIRDSLMLFRSMLEEYIQGKPLRNLVDVQAGY